VLAEHDLVLPVVVVEKVRRVLTTKLGVTPEALSAMDAVLGRCELVPRGTEPSSADVRDPDDDRVLSPRGFMVLARGGG
jgi:hypothetical protein